MQNTDPSFSTNYKTMNAATLPTVPVVDINSLQIPTDLALDRQKKRNVDTVYITNTDTANTRVVTKVKWRQAPVPDPIVVRDTIREAHYYLATQVGNKEGPTGECVPIYEVHKVGEVCSENSDPSTIYAPQHVLE